MTDWKYLPAGRELDRVIAEEVGYHPLNINDAPDGIKVRTISSWMLAGPGEDYQTARKRLDIHTGVSDPESTWKFAAAYSTNVDAALTLFDISDMGLSLNVFDGRWVAALTAWHISGGRGNGVADTPALAICRAFLDWKEKQKAE